MREKFIAVILCATLAGCATFHSERGHVSGAPKVYIVFFPVRSAALTPEAADIVKTAAIQIRKQQPVTVQIAAGVAPGGNMEMSRPRFAVVYKVLVDNGVPENIIARSAIPDPKLDTGPARQRLEIRLLDKAP